MNVLARRRRRNGEFDQLRGQPRPPHPNQRLRSACQRFSTPREHGDLRTQLTIGGRLQVSWITVRTLLGHGDHHITGVLKDWDVFDRLADIRIRTLVLGGEFDECVPSHLADVAARIPDSELVIQPGGTHMTYLEEEPLRRQYVAIIKDYLARIEAAEIEQ